MAAAVEDLDQQLFRVLFEALEAFANGDVVLSVLTAALDDTTFDGPPASPESVRRFLNQHLLPAVEARLGAEAAEGLLEGLLPVLHKWELSESQVKLVRRDDGVPREEGPTRTRGEGVAHVILATSDSSLRRELATMVGVAVAIDSVDGSLELFHRLEEAGTAARLLVIDCVEPPLSVTTLMRSATLLPEHTQVILWRAGQDVTLSSVPDPCRARWSIVRPPTTLTDLASMCAWLVNA
jgi:hypothetical protein